MTAVFFIRYSSHIFGQLVSSPLNSYTRKNTCVYCEDLRLCQFPWCFYAAFSTFTKGNILKDPFHCTDMLGLHFHGDCSSIVGLPQAYFNCIQVTLKANDRNTHQRKCVAQPHGTAEHLVVTVIRNSVTFNLMIVQPLLLNLAVTPIYGYSTDLNVP